ncbi:MAG TPA: FecR domain-containing protein [Tepidisphaeraceae bacterium]|jgi:hypothetical protein
MEPEDSLADEIIGMVDALLEDRLAPADVRRLEDLVCTNQTARRIYLRYIHLNCSIPPHLGVPAAEPPLPQESAAPTGQPADMHETLMMPALQAAAFEEEEEPSIVLPPAPQREVGRHAPLFTLRRYAAAAAILIIATAAITLYLNHTPRKDLASGVPTPTPPTTQPAHVAPPAPAPPAAPRPVAHLTALANAMIESPAGLHPGAPLLPGQSLRLKSGAAEVTYANGAVLVLEGPADLRITNASTARLDRGKLAARVPHAARWFRVTAAKLTVTDLGTEFGVDVRPDGLALAHVFEGRISVALPGTTPNAPAKVKLLERDQTVQCPIHGGPIESLPKLPEPFTRDITQYTLPVPLHNSGAGIAEGSPDPHWQFVGDSNDPNLVPRPATVAGAFTTTLPGKQSYLPNSTTSQWISTQGKLPAMPAGTYTFRTQIDLADLDPAAVKVIARVAADDEVSHVRVNGREVPLTALADRGRQYTRLHDLPLADGLVAGMNTVEFDVLNTRDQMALRVEWDATVRAPVVR